MDDSRPRNFISDTYKIAQEKIGKHKSHQNCNKYIVYRNTFNKLKRLTKQNYYDELLHKYQYNIRKTWVFINTLIGRSNDKSNISNTLKIKNTSINDAVQIAKEFHKHWKEICR